MNAERYNELVRENIGKIIQAKGLRQNAVAEWAGYTQQQFSDMRNGRKIIKPGDLIAIATALGVSVDVLFANSN